MNKDFLKVLKDNQHRIIRRPVINDNKVSGYVEYTYDAQGNVVEERLYSPNGKISRTEKQVYDNNGRLLQKREYGSKGEVQQVKNFEYNGENLGRTYCLLGEKEILNANYFYDEKNRVVKIVNSCSDSTKEILEMIKEYESSKKQDIENDSDDSEYSVYNEYYKDLLEDFEFVYDTSELEYNDDDLITKTVNKAEDGTVLWTEERQYQNQKIHKIVKTDYFGNVKTVTFEYPTENEEIFRVFDAAQKEILVNVLIYNDAGDVVKTITKDSDGIITEIYAKKEIISERIEQKSCGTIIHFVYNYDDNDILRNIEIKGNREIVFDKHNAKFLKNPVIVKYSLFKNLLIGIFTVFPVLLLIGALNIWSGLSFLLSEFNIISFIFLLFGLILVYFCLWWSVSVYKNRNKMVSYAIDTANKIVRFENISVVYNALFTRNDSEKDDLFLPVVIHFGAIQSGKFVKGGKYSQDRLYLEMNNGEEFDIPVTKKVLDVLEKFVPIKYKGLFPKSFIKSGGKNIWG